MRAYTIYMTDRWCDRDGWVYKYSSTSGTWEAIRATTFTTTFKSSYIIGSPYSPNTLMHIIGANPDINEYQYITRLYLEGATQRYKVQIADEGTEGVYSCFRISNDAGQTWTNVWITDPNSNGTNTTNCFLVGMHFTKNNDWVIIIKSENPNRLMVFRGNNTTHSSSYQITTDNYTFDTYGAWDYTGKFGVIRRDTNSDYRTVTALDSVTSSNPAWDDSVKILYSSVNPSSSEICFCDFWNWGNLYYAADFMSIGTQVARNSPGLYESGGYGVNELKPLWTTHGLYLGGMPYRDGRLRKVTNIDSGTLSIGSQITSITSRCNHTDIDRQRQELIVGCTTGSTLFVYDGTDTHTISITGLKSSLGITDFQGFHPHVEITTDSAVIDEGVVYKGLVTIN